MDTPVISLRARRGSGSYPERPIRFIVPSAPGGAPDINARLLAFELVKQMGQQIVIDNRPGAAGSIGTEMVVRAVPDGYTIGYGTVPALAINQSMYAKLPHDPEKDLRKVAQLGYQPNLLAVAPSLPVKSVKELIAYAKSSPGKLSYRLQRQRHNAAPWHGVVQAHDGHADGARAVQGGAAGDRRDDRRAGAPDVRQLQFDFPHVKAGRVRGLGVTTLQRSPALPDLPTLDEAGVSGFELTVWGGVVVPAGVPKPIVAKLNAEINKALAAPVLKEKFPAMGYTIVGGTPEQFEAFVKKEAAKWADVIKRSGAKVE